MQAVCSCISGFIGAPPICRPECVISSDCLRREACTNQKCQDPCPGSCGRNTICNVVNHNPICSCRPGMTGDPFVNCYLLRKLLPTMFFKYDISRMFIVQTQFLLSNDFVDNINNFQSEAVIN